MRKAEEQRRPLKEMPRDATPEGKDDACRCKETSQMTPRELLRVMISDLAFWKKEKK